MVPRAGPRPARNSSSHANAELPWGSRGGAEPAEANRLNAEPHIPPGTTPWPTYGSFQFPEKLLPLFIHNIMTNKPLPVYGKGENIRDWLWVEDHCKAIDLLFHQASNGSTYNIGGWNEWKNIDLIHLLISIMDRKLGRSVGESQQLISYVTDRPGHDLRYAIDASKLENDFGWRPSVTFEQGLEATVEWYLQNPEWVNRVTSGEYQKYYEKQYTNR